ncbi:uncharacterized protein [Argopecten irradians]|uniref:uncharacterized protein n=1 Tax=Argopecten irradians TaxID=31199 RepID=UPI0037189261
MAADPPRKRCRVDNCSEIDGHVHVNCTSKLRKDMTDELRRLCDTDCTSVVTLTPLSVLNSNAVDGQPFNKAFCRIGDFGEKHLFVSLFYKGLDIILKYLNDAVMPTEPVDRLVLDTLLHFLTMMADTDAQVPMEKFEGLTDAEVTIILANHLFGKLAISSNFLIDNHCKGKEDTWSTCPCSETGCRISGSYGDTSIGHGLVWHGELDIIVNDHVVLKTGEDPHEDSGLKSSPRVKPSSSCLVRNEQIIAETIVFSFLQKKRHPEYCQYLAPCIGITEKEMVVYFYDAEHDVLLQSSPIFLHSQHRTSVGHISLTAVLVAWLVLNHKYLCDGLPEALKTRKAGFYDTAESKLSVYQNELQFGNVALLTQAHTRPRPNIVSNPSVKKLENVRLKILHEKFRTN